MDKNGTRWRGRELDARRDDEDVNEGNVRWQEMELMTEGKLIFYVLRNAPNNPESIPMIGMKLLWWFWRDCHQWGSGGMGIKPGWEPIPCTPPHPAHALPIHAVFWLLYI